MDSPLLAGRWLLIDAAGPTSVAGLIEQDQWIVMEKTDKGFLEWLEPAIKSVLSKSSSQLPDLSGIIYASGPGSTLGLRLSALFCRTLLGLPELNHWSCWQYQNLELAILAHRKNENELTESMVAPWRRDRCHCVSVQATGPTQFAHKGIHPDEVAENRIPGVVLGRKPPSASNELDWLPYPLEEIPALLSACPELLTPVTFPTPYTAETPDFVRWNPKRHTGK
jgi:tRNA A37 threonylcarbamoyladenosine modification protein TsaB